MPLNSGLAKCFSVSAARPWTYKLHLLLLLNYFLIMQSDLVSLSLTIALPKALGSASARGEFSPSTRASPPLVSIANHAGVGSLQGEAQWTYWYFGAWLI
jgi:hypothetical protein